ncbi:putative FAD-linked oxidoreductase Rv2280 [Massilia sp. Bi118]|uniref:FAD-binding oxidoreductase n=1 Tax=Massilia sp. Bi118 TaxID=2822346 RepID=UPI001D65C9B1|nr:FAD-linked oxidase C-terminal domain-containing protein [Massilia sp. Bi118]CAH0268666.1 putative FAD-linked oxidoreductase Rv2280 [Massilia sp. Bi118]
MNQHDPQQPAQAAFGAVDHIVGELQARFGERVSVARAVREQHARGEGLATSLAPDAVVWPLDKHEVCAILALCNLHRVPVIAFGAGSSLEGHVSAPYGGVCIDMSRMNAVIQVNPADSDCVVQPGITREDLNAHLKGTGLFFPVDPGANATIGGMVSTRASGTTTIRYGSMAHNVQCLEVALADGRLVRLGSRARKSSAGYDLVHLMTGAEGTLGVITEITLRLHPLPTEVAAAACAFPTLDAAVEAVTEMSLTGVPFARIEFLDDIQVRACNLHSQLGLKELPTLFLEFHGTELAVKEQAELAQEIAASYGGIDFQWATRPEDRSRLWHARHLAYFAALALRPGCTSVVADICVPMSALADCVREARAMIDKEGLIAPILGHVGDGNFHVLFMPMPDQPEEHAAVDRVYGALIEHALAAGGTCTGEHGIGMGKKAKLLQEYGGEVVGLMASIKQALDPNGILNPGKICS